MTVRMIPDEHHVSRHVKNSHTFKTLTGERRVEAEAFVPRPGEEFLSVDWVEYFEGTPREQLNQICKVLLEIRKYDVKRDSAFAVVNCLKIRNVGNSNGHDLSVMTLGEQEDPSHSGVYGLPGNPESDIIHQEIANCASVESAYD